MLQVYRWAKNHSLSVRPGRRVLNQPRSAVVAAVAGVTSARVPNNRRFIPNVLEYSATRRPRRGDILDQRGTAWNAISHDLRIPQTFFAPVSPIRRATVVRGPPEPSDRSCAIEELRRICCSKLNTAPSHDGPV